MKSKKELSITELRREASKVNLNRSIQLNNHTFVNNGQKSFDSLIGVYEAQTTDRQRERYYPYFLHAKEIVNKCR